MLLSTAITLQNHDYPALDNYRKLEEAFFETTMVVLGVLETFQEFKCYIPENRHEEYDDKTVQHIVYSIESMYNIRFLARNLFKSAAFEMEREVQFSGLNATTALNKPLTTSSAPSASTYNTRLPSSTVNAGFSPASSVSQSSSTSDTSSSTPHPRPPKVASQVPTTEASKGTVAPETIGKDLIKNDPITVNKMRRWIKNEFLGRDLKVALSDMTNHIHDICQDIRNEHGDTNDRLRWSDIGRKEERKITRVGTEMR